MKITRTDKLLAFAIALGLAAFFGINAAFATNSNPCKNQWCVNEQNQTQTQQQHQNQTQQQTASAVSTANSGDSRASINGGISTEIGDTNATGGNSSAVSGASTSEGGTVTNSGNSRSNSNVSDSGNANLVDSGNSQATIQNTIIHRYPITLTNPQLLEGQQGIQLYSELHGVSLDLIGKQILFISEQYNADKSNAISLCGIIDSASSHGLSRFMTRGRAQHNQYKSPIQVTKELAKRAPKGTNQIVALVSTSYHSRGAGLAGGGGEMTDSGVTRQLTAGLSGAVVLPFPVVRVYYCSNELVVE